MTPSVPGSAVRHVEILHQAGAALRTASHLASSGSPEEIDRCCHALEDAEAIPPEAFARAAAAASFRFLIVPTDEPEWSRQALEAVARTGAFGPARRFTDVALLERVPGRPAGPRGSVPGSVGSPQRP